MAWIVALVAGGAYGAGSTHLVQVILSGTDAKTATAAPVAVAAISPATTPATTSPVAPTINDIAKADRGTPRPPIAAGVLQTAALFAPAMTAPGGTFVRPAPSAAPTAIPVAVAANAADAAKTAAQPTSAATIPQTAVAALVPSQPPVAPSASSSGAPVVLAYASPKTVPTTAPFDAVISDKPKTSVLDPDIDANHAWLNTPLPDSVKSAAETKCLAQAIYFEARDQPQKGQIAVAQVVLNRVKNPAFPKSICDVVFQNAEYLNACQFSFACDGLPETIDEPDAWNTSLTLAQKILADPTNLYLPDIGAATHYHADYVSPDWAPEMQRVAKIGEHIFYKTYDGGWG